MVYSCDPQGYMAGAPSFGPMGLMGMTGSQGGLYADDGGAAGLGHGYNDSECTAQAPIPFSAGSQGTACHQQRPGTVPDPATGPVFRQGGRS